MCLRVKHYTFAGKNMILKGNSPLSQDEQFRLQLVELKEQVEQKLQSLLRHLTLIDSTVLGILSAFHDERSGCTYTHLLPVAGSALLFLSLLSGLYCMWQGYRTSQKSLTRLFRAYSERNFPPPSWIYTSPAALRILCHALPHIVLLGASILVGRIMVLVAWHSHTSSALYLSFKARRIRNVSK